MVNEPLAYQTGHLGLTIRHIDLIKEPNAIARSSGLART